MAYTPTIWTKDGVEEIAETAEEAVRLEYEGWLREGEAPLRDPLSYAADKRYVLDQIELAQAELSQGGGATGLTPAQLDKLNGIAEQATRNLEDAVLVDRQSHTGFQSADTVNETDDRKFFTPSERSKLSQISAGATVNDLDANLRSRASHTGFQTMSTISGLSDALTAKFDKPTGNASQYVTGTGALANLNKFSVALGNVDNVSAADLRARASHTGTQTSSTISDFAEAVEDAVAALLARSSHVGISYTYDDAGNLLGANVSGAGGGSFDAESARDALGVALVGQGNISILVDDANDKITISTTATQNDTDANLRNRQSHTGTQPMDTITETATLKILTSTERTKLAGIATGAMKLAFKGPVRSGVAYEPGDIIVFRGQRVVVTTAFTAATTVAPATPFVSSGFYTQLGSSAVYYAADWGVVGDGTNDQLAKLNDCLSHVKATTGGGTIVLPQGIIQLSSGIDLPSMIRLVGQGIGPNGTMLRLAANANSHGVTFHTSTGSGDSNAFWGGLEDMQIHGNRWSQGLTTFHHGINVVTNPTSTAQTGDPDFDPAHHFKNLILKNWTGHGFFHQGRSDLFLSSVHSKDNFGAGFYLSFDTRIVGCTAGFNGVCGFWYQGSSTQTTASKSYNNGKHAFWASGTAYAVGTYVMYAGSLYRATTTIASGDTTAPGTDGTKWTLVWAGAPWGTGFAVRGNHLKELVFSACDAQQNSGSGLDFRQSSVVFQGTVTQPNFDNTANSTGAVFTTNPNGYASVLLDGAHECIIDVLSNGTSSVTPHVRAISSLVNSDLRIVGDPTSILLAADGVAIAANNLVFNGVKQGQLTVGNMPTEVPLIAPYDAASRPTTDVNRRVFIVGGSTPPAWAVLGKDIQLASS